MIYSSNKLCLSPHIKPLSLFAHTHTHIAEYIILGQHQLTQCNVFSSLTPSQPHQHFLSAGHYRLVSRCKSDSTTAKRFQVAPGVQGRAARRLDLDLPQWCCSSHPTHHLHHTHTNIYVTRTHPHPLLMNILHEFGYMKVKSLPSVV